MYHAVSAEVILSRLHPICQCGNRVYEAGFRVAFRSVCSLGIYLKSLSSVRNSRRTLTMLPSCPMQFVYSLYPTEAEGDPATFGHIPT